MSAQQRGSTKQRMLDSAVLLLRERGAPGVTVDAVLAHSGAPRGSVYHHFPGGRNELILGAVAQAGDYLTAMVDDTARDGDILRTVERLVRFWKKSLAATDFRAGCPVVAMAVDGREEIPGAAELVRETFARLETSLSGMLTGSGFQPERAVRLATLVVSAIEGAIILSRARRDVQPLDDVLSEIAPLLDSR